MTDINYYMGRERQRDLLREAELEREVRAALRNGKRNNSTVAWMGRRLTNIGNQLIAASGEKN